MLEQFEVIAAMLGTQCPRSSRCSARPAATLAFTGFPVAHWKKIWSANPCERLNKEVERRIYVVGVFPNLPRCSAWPVRFLVEAHDEWQLSAEGRYFSERSMALVIENKTGEVAKPKLMSS